MRPNLLPLRSLLWLTLLAPAVAAARHPVEDLLDEIDRNAVSIQDTVVRLDEQVAPGRGFITNAQASERYQDSVYLFMLGEYEKAAEGFFTLVTTAALADAGLHRDAEWYLAEALFMMGNLATAEARYQVIADDMQHPFRDDAVRRLLELYASSDQTEAFYAYYEQEIVMGRVRASDIITYAVARAFYQSDDLDRAVRQFEAFQQGSAFYRKAQYFLGAIAVKQGDLDRAVTVFSDLANESVDTLEDRQVLDLALLALGRIHYERGDFDEAVTAYDRIGGDSEYLADKLYELTWAYIKQGQEQHRLADEKEAEGDLAAATELRLVRTEHYRKALRGVEIFLLAYSEHQYAAQLRVLQGHLHMLMDQRDDALDAYEKVIVDYTPIRERFGKLARADEDGAVYFQTLADLDRDATAGDLPPYAMAMMMADNELSRALSVYRELEKQRRDVEISEQLIAELDRVLGASAGIGGFDQLRYDTILNQTLATDLQLELLRAEESWLADSVTGSLAERLGDLKGRRETLERELAEETTRRETRQQELQEQLQMLRSEARTLRDTVEQLRAETRSLRAELARGTSAADPAAQADIQARLTRLDADLADAQTALTRIEKEEAVKSASAAELESSGSGVADRVGELRREYRKLREGAGAGADRVVGDRLDKLHDSLDEMQRRLAGVRQRIETTENSELGRIRQRFNFEVREVAEQRAELDRTTEEAQRVSIELTRAGFGRLEDFFAESVLKADMGIVDVYWSEKLEVADQKTRVQEEKAALLADLEERFALIRLKLGQ